MLQITYFVCLSYLLIAADVVRCKPDYLYSHEADGWLKLHSIPATWEEAFLRCHYEGAVLASPLNKELAKALHSQLAEFENDNERIYLGTHDLYSKGHFASVEGVPLSDMEIEWRSHHPGANTEDCLTMSVHGDRYYMSTSSCKDPLPFICYRKLDNHTTSECGTFDKGESFEDVFNEWDDGQPNNLGDIQNRASFTGGKGGLDDVQPGFEAMFVCEKSPTSVQFEAVPHLHQEDLLPENSAWVQ